MRERERRGERERCAWACERDRGVPGIVCEREACLGV